MEDKSKKTGMTEVSEESKDAEKSKKTEWNHNTSDLQDLKISGDGSRVFCLGYQFIQAWSIHTAEVVGEVQAEQLTLGSSLTVDDSRVWAHYSEYQGWDFGTPESSPIQLPNTPPSRLHPNGIMLWEIPLCRIKDTRTGKVVFQLPKRYGKPKDVQWNGQYLIICFSATDALILDFSYIL